jgi:hypothetical protein
MKLVTILLLFLLYSCAPKCKDGLMKTKGEKVRGKRSMKFLGVKRHCYYEADVAALACTVIILLSK